MWKFIPNYDAQFLNRCRSSNMAAILKLHIQENKKRNVILIMELWSSN